MRSIQRTASTFAIGFAFCFLVGVPRVVAAGKPLFEHIRFDDLAAELPVRIAWSWNAIGMDPEDNVYVVFGGPMGQSHDCVLFRYSPKTGERRLLGTMANAAKAANNWQSGEARKIRAFPPEESMGWVTGSDIRDRFGNIYFARHGGGFCGLLKINVGNVDTSDSGQMQ